MRVVYDTNVVISGVLFGGRPLEAVNAAMHGDVVSVTSQALMAELEATLARKFKLGQALLAMTVQEYANSCIFVAPTKTIAVLDDEPDNRVLEAAVEGDCAYIVTGDKALLALGTFQNVQIVTVDQFLQMYVE